MQGALLFWLRKTIIWLQSHSNFISDFRALLFSNFFHRASKSKAHFCEVSRAGHLVNLWNWPCNLFRIFCFVLATIYFSQMCGGKYWNRIQECKTNSLFTIFLAEIYIYYFRLWTLAKNFNSQGTTLEIGYISYIPEIPKKNTSRPFLSLIYCPRKQIFFF